LRKVESVLKEEISIEKGKNLWNQDGFVVVYSAGN
jgi:hypothetical protein